MPAILEVKNLIKRYGDHEAVKGISFDIQEGEIFSLLGPNGAGKTTTISVLSTLYTATSGDAVIAGHSVSKEPMEVRKEIGVVPQDLALYDDLSARENLVFWGQMYGLSGKALKARVDEVLAQIGLADRARERVKTYSGGMKRRVNIGVGLLHKPRLLFMDEPTVGIDPQSRRAILDSVKDLNKHGMTVLYTTHYMEEAQELSDRVGIIDYGKIIALGTPGDLIQQVGEQDRLVFKVGQAVVSNEMLEHIRTSVEGVTRAIFDPPGEEGENKTNISGLLVVSAKRGRKALPFILHLAEQAGIEIESVEVREPNLEAVFLHLTGRALRD